MPVILNNETREMWLSSDMPFDYVKASIDGSNASVLLTQSYKVSTYVNSIKNDGEKCSMPLQ